MGLRQGTTSSAQNAMPICAPPVLLFLTKTRELRRLREYTCVNSALGPNLWRVGEILGSQAPWQRAPIDALEGVVRRGCGGRLWAGLKNCQGSDAEAGRGVWLGAARRASNVQLQQEGAESSEACLNVLCQRCWSGFLQDGDQRGER
jgi:hypothetical protein